MLDQSEIGKAISILKNGGVIAFPTDTVYGIGANAFDEKAVEKIYQIKGRPKNKPIAVLVSSINDLTKITIDVPPIFYELAEKYWPGALTMILESNETLPTIVTAGFPTVGVRMPDNTIALSLIRGLKNPIVATSANLSGAQPATSAEQVRKFLKDRVDFVIDDGHTKIGVASTVVDLTTSPHLVRRQGTITIADCRFRIAI